MIVKTAQTIRDTTQGLKNVNALNKLHFGMEVIV